MQSARRLRECLAGHGLFVGRLAPEVTRPVEAWLARLPGGEVLKETGNEGEDRLNRSSKDERHPE